jgi:hypothetical protein
MHFEVCLCKLIQQEEGEVFVEFHLLTFEDINPQGFSVQA